MSLAVCVLMTWIVIVILSLIPKKLSELDMVFLFFVNTVFELSIFTILHVNLKWIEVNRSVEKSFADLVLRIVMIPLIFVITANIMKYDWKYLKWMIVSAIILNFFLMQALIKKLGILSIHHWNPFYTIGLFCSYALFSSLMAWFIHNVDSKGVSEN